MIGQQIWWCIETMVSFLCTILFEVTWALGKAVEILGKFVTKYPGQKAI